MPPFLPFSYLCHFNPHKIMEMLRCFYHPNYASASLSTGIGSSASTMLSNHWLTDSTGQAIQHLHYLPFGEDWVDQRNSSWNAPYTFSGKEKDAETGYGYFGARYYDSGLSIWLSVDPMSDKYPSMSPYNYCVNNPVIMVDPDGRDNVIYLVYLGNNKNFTNKFVKYANQALKDMGLETSISVVKDPNKFDVNKMDKNDMLLVIGDCQKVKDYIKKVSPDNFLWFNDWYGNTTFVQNPERATNSRKGAKRNIVGIDIKDIGSQLNTFNVTLDYYLTSLTLHGMGHNAGYFHTDEYGYWSKEQTFKNSLVMCSGQYFKTRISYPTEGLGDITKALDKSYNSYILTGIKNYYEKK